MKQAPKTISILVTREVTFAVQITVAREYDDDGCGDPIRSGNSMTGCRGSHLVADKIEIDNTDLLIDAAIEAVSPDDDDIVEALEDI